MKSKIIFIVCLSLLVLVSMGAISASEDIANDTVTAIETADEPIVQEADDEIAVQAADDEANAASDEEILTDDEFELLTPYDFYITGSGYSGPMNTFSVDEKFKIGVNGTKGAKGTFSVYYAGHNDFGFFKWNDTALAYSEINDGFGVVEMSIPQAGGLYGPLWGYTDLWIEYNTTKGSGNFEYIYLEIIENPKTTNASISPLTFVEGGNNSVNLRFSSQVDGNLFIYVDEQLRGLKPVYLEETVPGKKYDYSTTIDYLTVGTHAIRLYFNQVDYDEDLNGPNPFRYSKTFYVTVKKWEPTIIQTATKITASPVTLTYNTANSKVTFTLMDENNKVISGEKVSITFNGKTYNNLVTNSQGKISLDVSSKLVPKTYSAVCKFAGDESYKASSKTVNVVVKKATPKLTAAKKTFKKSQSKKSYTVTLKTNKGAVMKKTKVTLTVNKKTYTGKTNSKGQVTFKITNLKKKGKFTAVVKYGGNSYYNAKTVKPVITVK